MLDDAPSHFPEIASVVGIVKTMAELDRAFDNLKHIRNFGWRTPPDHPDLVPADEAERIESLLVGLRQDPGMSHKPAEFLSLLRAATGQAGRLVQAVARDTPRESQALLQALADTCRDCHVKYRN